MVGSLFVERRSVMKLATKCLIGLVVALLSFLGSGAPRAQMLGEVMPVASIQGQMNQGYDRSAETKEQRDARMKWWHEAKFGMFIHWGVYAVPAGVYHDKDIPGIGEWIMHDAKIPVAEYRGYAKQFNPTLYDPAKWVKTAKDAGMKYIVITSKHHDGFALFDSKASDWNVVKATPYGKDLLKPLAEECRKQGIKLGFYYSQAQDWNNPGGAAADGHWDKAQDGDMDEYIKKVAVPQVKEILTNYGDVAVLWWDTPYEMTKERAGMFLPLVNMQPNIITNDRLGGDCPGDTGTPEQRIPDKAEARDWETCMTINDTWGYKVHDTNWKSAKTLIQNLADIASKGGNYLLNVGPKPDGTFPPEIVERLAEVGKWMKVNGESVYGTTASPCGDLPFGRVTAKPGKLYIHVFDWPQNGKVLVPTKLTVTKAYLLADPAKKALTLLNAGTKAEGMVIEAPAQAPDANDSVIVLECTAAAPQTAAPGSAAPKGAAPKPVAAAPAKPAAQSAK
jgi:alpha-L-fucosidase